MGLSRRGFMGGAAAVGSVGATGGVAQAEDRQGLATEATTGRLPGREEFVVRGAYVLTMDPALGDLSPADVHVREGRIVAVGKNLRARGREFDGRDTIVMPGLIDTHWHMWTTLHRSLAASSPDNAYFALNLRLGPHVRPQDIYNGVRLALVEAISSGITTVHDWAHNIRGPAWADANIRAHVSLGLRGRFSYGPSQGHPADQTIDLDDLQRVHDEWFASGRAGSLRLGLAGRSPGTVPPSVYRAEFEKTRELGLPVSYHAASNRDQGRQRMIETLDGEGFLGPGTQIIHALFATEAERKAMGRSGTSVSSSPWSELLIGYGVPPIAELMSEGVLLNLSVDTLPLTGTAEMFSVMRLMLGLARGQAEQEFALTARRVLAMATIDAAKGLGLSDVTGSLTPGKRADLILVRTDDANIAPFTDAPNMIVLAAQPHNVDTVVVDGRILKHRGRLTTVDADQVVAEAEESLTAVLDRAGMDRALPGVRNQSGRDAPRPS
jgi:5-methylthioadenosine/S-adenosylhomocysteine deaminase